MKRIIGSAGTHPQIIFTALLAILTVFIHIRFYEYGFDDAYIHFRIARNLLDTGTPYYNLGEAVKVSTSSGWIIVLAPVIWATRVFQAQNSLPLVVSILNSLFTVLGMLTYTRIIHRLAGKHKVHFLVILAFQIIYVALMIPASTGLMETPLALLLAGLGIHFIQLDRRIGYLLFGIAAYIRVEIGVLILLAGLFVLIQKRDRVIEAILFTVAGFLPFLLFDLHFFRSIIPNSIPAKSVIYDIRGVETVSTIIFSSLPTYFLLNDNMTVFASNLILLTGILYLAVKFGLDEWRSSGSSQLLMIALWSGLSISLYIAASALIFDWYIPLYVIPLAVAISATVIVAGPPYNMLAYVFFFVLLLISCGSLGRTVYAAFDHPSQYILFESGSRVRMYRKMAAILSTEYPQSRLLSSEIGGLGYEFTGKILDAAGLASPQALRYHPMKVPEERERGNLGAIPPAFVEETLPEIIVSYDSFAMALLNSEIIERYNVVVLPAYLPEDGKYSNTGLIWGNKYLRIYIRKDLPVSEEILELGIN